MAVPAPRPPSPGSWRHVSRKWPPSGWGARSSSSMTVAASIPQVRRLGAARGRPGSVAPSCRSAPRRPRCGPARRRPTTAASPTAAGTPRRQRLADVPPPPATRVDDLVETLGGIQVADPYRWLEDGASLEVRAWTTAQNARTRAVLDAVPARARFRDRLAELAAGSAPPPRRRSAATGSSRSTAGATATAPSWSCGRSPRPSTGPGEVLLDPADVSRRSPHRRSTGTSRRPTATLRGLRHLHRRRRALDAADPRGRHRRAPRRRDPPHPRRVGGLAARRLGLRLHPLPRSRRGRRRGGRLPPHGLVAPPRRRPSPTTSPASPTCPTKEAWPEVSLSADGRWLLVHVELGLEPHRRAPARPRHRRLDHGREPAIEATTWLSVDGDRARLVGTTTLGAPKGRRRGRAPAATRRPATGGSTWSPEGDDVLARVRPHRRHLLVLRTRAGVSSLHHHDADGQRTRRRRRAPRRPRRRSRRWPATRAAPASSPSGTRPSPAPTPCTAWRPGGEADPAHPPPRPLRSTPPSWPRCATRRRDGVEVPMLLVHGAGTAVGAGTPTVLTGYGGFNITETPAWSPFVAAWCELGRPGGGGRAAGRRRGGRGVAPGRHAGAQAAGVRRLRGGRRLAGGRGPHLARAAGHPGRLERRPAGGRLHHPAPRPVRGGRVRRPPHRHGALPAVPHRPALDPRVRRPRRPRGAGLAPRLLALPPGRRRHLLPGPC